MITTEINATIVETLRKFKLKPRYSNEQNDLQKHIFEEIRKAVPDTYTVVRSIEGKGKPSVKALGTSFWLDVEIRDPETGGTQIAVEVKWIKPNASPAKSLEETLGQVAIYSTIYDHSIAFVLHEGKYNPKQRDNDQQLIEQLAKINVELIIRRR